MGILRKLRSGCRRWSLGMVLFAAEFPRGRSAREGVFGGICSQKACELLLVLCGGSRFFQSRDSKETIGLEKVELRPGDSREGPTTETCDRDTAAGRTTAPGGSVSAILENGHRRRRSPASSGTGTEQDGIVEPALVGSRAARLVGCVCLMPCQETREGICSHRSKYSTQNWVYR